jgi:hypothetical protein
LGVFWAKISDNNDVERFLRTMFIPTQSLYPGGMGLIPNYWLIMSSAAICWPVTAVDCHDARLCGGHPFGPVISQGYGFMLTPGAWPASSTAGIRREKPKQAL